MAIYPQTTCFYKGVIKEKPKAGMFNSIFFFCFKIAMLYFCLAGDDYLVLFEDSSYADGYSPPLSVAQRYIIQVPDKKKGK